MYLEETKKIIRNKIVADETAREVRSQIVLYSSKTKFERRFYRNFQTIDRNF